jgi:hypothetical protein
MTKNAFDKISSGLTEVLDMVRDESSRESDDMMEGYRDGYDSDAPDDPSPSRSELYRYGFVAGRVERESGSRLSQIRPRK